MTEELAPEPIPHWPGRLFSLGGREDRLVDPRSAGRAAHAFRNGRIVVMPRTGHVAHMEHPQAVAAEISQLLRKAVSAPEPAREFPLTRTG
ncbi:MAG: alpha/beta fold hydrolase [Streptosporangiaceae bacterium]